MAAIHGVVFGTTIELNQAPGLPDGQPVVVTIERVAEAVFHANDEKSPRVEDWVELLVFDSSVAVGGWIVKGTNLSAEALVAELTDRGSDQELLAAHPELTEQDVAALRQYARLPQAFRQTFGAWAEEGDKLDRYLELLRHRRRLARPELAP